MIIKNNPKDFLSILGKVASMLGDIPLLFDSDGLTIGTLDKSHVMMFFIKFPTEYFDKSDNTEFSIGVNGIDLSKVLMKFKDVDTFKMDYNPSTRRLELITISKSHTRKIELNTLALDDIELLTLDNINNLHGVEYDTSLVCNLGEFLDEIDLIQILTDESFALKASKDQFAIITSNSGLYGSGGSLLNNITDYQYDGDGDTIASFNCGMVSKISKFKTDIINIKIGFSYEKPLWITFVSDDFEFEMFFAPVVPLDDEYTEDDE